MLNDKNVLAVQCSNIKNEQYALFCDDKGVYHGNDKDGYTFISVLENIIHLERPIKIYYHFPYICITERYGLNAAVVNILDRHVLKLVREDYHCDVSSYSIGFLEHKGRVLLIHQTSDNIMCFETEQFLKEYEPCGEHINYYRGYAWDKPCVFIGNDTFVIAADKDEIKAEDGINEAELREPPAYHQLLFYKLSEIKADTYTYSGYEGYDTFSIAYSGKADCDVFTFDKYGDIEAGELYYDDTSGHLIALSAKGAFELTLDGRILHSDPEIKLYVDNWAMRRDARMLNPLEWCKNWQYDVNQHLFYRFIGDKIKIKRFT